MRSGSWRDGDRAVRSVVIDLADEMDLLEFGPRAATCLAAAGEAGHAINILRVVRGIGALWTDPDLTEHFGGGQG